MQAGYLQFSGGRVWVHDAQIGDHRGGSGGRQAKLLTPAGAAAVTDAGDKVQLRNKAALVLSEDDEYLFGRCRDLGRAPGAGEADGRFVVSSDHCRVQVGVPVNLGRPEET